MSSNTSTGVVTTLGGDVLITALFVTELVPAGTGVTMRTANVTLSLNPPPGTDGTISVQLLPSVAPSAQLQPGELLPASKTVLAGTVS